MDAPRPRWPDADRRDVALERLGLRLDGVATSNRKRRRDVTAGGEYLSVAELRVLLCMSYGLGERGAADVLGLRVGTVKAHLAQARRRLRAKDTSHAVAEALRRSLIV